MDATVVHDNGGVRERPRVHLIKKPIDKPSESYLVVRAFNDVERQDSVHCKRGKYGISVSNITSVWKT